ncbi:MULTISPECIES: low temperature requirement protein A [Cryobacterium]|uniref:Low temperature requirement protein A n=1 Tax=Cryobacterium mannosilyticum TaxID=1259190 RepID=A0A4V3IDE9_9MICO|nr:MULTISPECIES: low temperature requirement protein A [Cryobacterium]TFB92465.1 low temperature requirement protein A [Cryobacterium sp. HLT2-28]TFC06046.1 low temperature requirement protein A [Cryobacterium mannosilyticum]
MTARPKDATHPSTPALGLRRDLARPADHPRTDRVTYIELFFDLVFVFALTQLSRFLYENQSWVGALESATLVLALWWVWVHTTWVTNVLDPARLPVRLVVIGLSLVGLLLSVSIGESFGDRGLTFALAYVALQLGRTVFMALALARHDRVLYRNFLRILVWLSVSGVFWIMGALLPLEFRLPLWIAGLLVEYVSASIGFRLPGLGRSGLDDWDLSGPHIAERSALFVIIALGESILVSGFAFVDQDASLPGVLGLLLAFTGGVMMWWLYFDHGERAGSRAIAASAEPGRIARLAYTYVHAIIIAGIVLTSVADKEILAHPDEPMRLSTAVVITGGPFVYLIGLQLFRWIVARQVLASHLAGIALLALAFAAAGLVSPLALAGLCTAVLMLVAAWETIVRLRAGTTDADAG